LPSFAAARRFLLCCNREEPVGTITISVPDDRLAELQQAAQRLGVPPEELVRASLEQLLAQPDDKLQRALDYVLKKNTELYRRMA
jgi:hypothetical protein